MDIFNWSTRRKRATAAVLLLAPLLIYLTSRIVNQSLQSLIVGVTEILFNLIAIVGLWLASKQYRYVSKKYHIAWLFLFFATSSTLVADLVWRFSTNPYIPNFFLSTADIVYIFEYLCFFVAMGIFGSQHFNRIVWLKRAFDVSIIVISTMLVFLIFVFTPAINLLETQNNTGTFLLMLYPLADIILMFAVLAVLYFKPRKVNLIPFWFFLASFAVMGATDYFFGLRMINGVYSARDMVNIGWWYSNMLFGLAGFLQYKFLVTKENTEVIHKKTTAFRKWLSSWMVYSPYMMVAGVYLLFIIYHNSDLNLMRELLTGLGAIFGLVLVRQVVVISENRQLLGSLSHANHKLKLHTQDLQGEIEKGNLVQEKLSYDTMHDSLTGLSNRVLFTNRLEHAIEVIKRKPGLVYSVLFLDMDDFKSINDILGHNAGDLALIELGHRLGKCIRTIDTLARFGGDEFVILLENTEDLDVTLSVANRILVELQRPFIHNETKVTVTCSIGIVQSIQGYRNSEEVLRDVDIAMYTAKKTGKAKFEIFNIEMGTAATYQLEIEGELYRAITNKELFLQYQPIINLANQKIVGFEALLRWQHPMRGLLEPDDFIPIAEESGAINPIGEWVLRAACEQMQDWCKTCPEAEDMFLSINLSGKQILKPTLVECICQILEVTGLNAHQLTLEVTENTLVMDEKVVTEQITALRAMGIAISVDDFGTGYSSLYNLYNFHIDEIKIDNIFAEKISPGKKNYEICSSLIQLARQLGIRTVIEGIEETNQLEVFTNLDCDLGQGYLLARPMLASDVQRIIFEEQIFQIP